MSALPDLVEDRVFQPILGEVLTAVRTELEAAGGPGLCFCGIVPAGRPPLGVMDCESKLCGVAWISPASAFPSTAFPAPDEEGMPVPCQTGMAMDLQIGVARCMPRPGRGEARVSEQTYFETTRLILSDMAAVRRALLCTFGARRDRRVMLRTWEPIEPEGGATGGVWTVSVA